MLAFLATLALLTPAASGEPSPAASSRAPSAAEPVRAAATIHIQNFTFVPKSLTIRAGQTVAFVNDDDEAHTVTAVDKGFDSEGLDSQKTWTHVFARAGTFAYFCELHPYMKATIVVTPAAAR